VVIIEIKNNMSTSDELVTLSFHYRDRSLFIPGVGTEEIWVG
jgi:hypothetical protein